jgi:hypothetical protein
MHMADDIHTTITMVLHLKWCVETLCLNMKGKWSSPQTGSLPSPQAQLGTFLQELARSFWLAHDADLFIHLAHNEEHAPIERDVVRQKLMEIGLDDLPRLRNIYVTQCDEVIQNLLLGMPEELERDPMGRPVLLDGVTRMIKKPIEVSVIADNIVLYLLMSIRANLDPSPQKVPRVSLPSVRQDPRRATHIQSLLRQLTQL